MTYRSGEIVSEHASQPAGLSFGQLAELHGFGAWQSTHQLAGGKLVRNSLLMAFLAVALGYIAVRGAQAGGWYWIGAVLFGIFALSSLRVVVSQLRRAAAMRETRIRLYEHGMVTQSPKEGLIAFPWSDVQVFRSATSHYKYGSERSGPIWTDTAFRFRSGDGREFTIDSDISQAAVELGDRVLAIASEAQKAPAAAALNSGAALEFGPVRLSAQSISTGEREVPWSQVDHVTIERGIFSVFVPWTEGECRKTPRGMVDVIRVEVGKIPNLPLFNWLVDALAQGRWSNVH
jgi:Family of unknown function (DUF6585)